MSSIFHPTFPPRGQSLREAPLRRGAGGHVSLDRQPLVSHHFQIPSINSPTIFHVFLHYRVLRVV